MADAAEFTLLLNDRLSGPAKGAARSIDRLDNAMGRLEHGATKGTFLGTLFGDIASRALDAAAAVLRLGANAAMSFARAVGQAALLREQFVKAFDIQMGGAGGLAEFERIRDIAVRIGAPLEQTEQFFLRMRSLKFPTKQAEELFLRMQDLKVSARLSADQLDRTLVAITQIKSTGKLQGDELMQLAEAGVDTGRVMENIAEAMGVTVDQARKLKEAGKIDAGTAIAAIQKTMGEMAGGKGAGEVAKDFADNTMSGILQKLQNLIPVIFDDIAKAAGPGLQKLQPIFAEIFDFLTGTEGKEIFKGIGEAIGMIGSAAQMAWPFLKAFIGGFSEGFGEALGPLKEVGRAFLDAFGGDGGDTMKKLVPIARDLGKALGFLAVFFGIAVAAGLAFFAALGALIGMSAAVAGAIFMAVAKVATWLGETMAKVVGFGQQLLTAGTTAATNLINGLVNGITSGAQRVVDAVKGLATGATNALSSTLKIHSPSKVFAGMGENLGFGLSEGVTSSESTVRTASSRMGDAAATGAGDPIDTAASAGSTSGFSSGGGITVNVMYQPTPGMAPEDARAQAEAASPVFRREILAAFEALAPAPA